MNFVLNITPWPVLSALLWIVLIVSALFFARPTAHALILATGRSLYKIFRTASLAVSKAQKNLAERNREVLLAAGREAKERIVEREFHRINETVRKDLANYSALHRNLRAGDDPVRALARAQREVADAHAHPAYWAPFVIVLSPG